MNEKSDPFREMMSYYQEIVEKCHPGKTAFWPLISGFDSKVATFRDTQIFIFVHSGTRTMQKHDGLGEISPASIGVENITEDNCDTVRLKLEELLGLKPQDGIIFLRDQKVAKTEFLKLLDKHIMVMGGGAMKIFLSHKGINKPMVREFSETFALFGFKPWLDEDAMAAGVELERGILQGFKESCAAVFFITPEFKDESFLSTEINYAISQKREKGNRFAIITIVFEKNGLKGCVPELLKQYVWKEPNSQLKALQEIVKALPITTGIPKWKQL